MNSYHANPMNQPRNPPMKKPATAVLTLSFIAPPKNSSCVGSHLFSVTAPSKSICGRLYSGSGRDKGPAQTESCDFSYGSPMRAGREKTGANKHCARGRRLRPSGRGVNQYTFAPFLGDKVVKQYEAAVHHRAHC